MINTIPHRVGSKLALLIMCLPLAANAQQYFTDTSHGDVNFGFRKTGSFQETYEMVTYAGNISNFLAMPVGTSTNFTFYTNGLATMCPDGLGNLQWSVFASSSASLGPLTNSVGIWPIDTCWYTVPRTSVGVQTTPVGRFSYTTGGQLQDRITSVSSGALALSETLYASQGNTNAGNNFQLILEPVADASDNNELTYFISDPNNAALGDFGGLAFTFSVENVTSNSFTAPVISDFYANVHAADAHHPAVDPITGLTNGVADYVGYFTLNPNGVLSFTRAMSVTAPTVSSLSASATNGFGPLTVVFSDSTSGSATNWVWNFGNGVIITNTTAGNVTNTYATAGTYTVTLTVYGPGGSTTYTVANYIVTSPTPKISLTSSNGKLVFSGANCPGGVQYRILTSTNILAALPGWKPVYTNTFANNGTFSYTNNVGSGNAFYIMVSP